MELRKSSERLPAVAENGEKTNRGSQNVCARLYNEEEEEASCLYFASMFPASELCQKEEYLLRVRREREECFCFVRRTKQQRGCLLASLLLSRMPERCV